MLAVHFGAGNIGRGFIGSLLYKAGYHTTFIDVNQPLIDAINNEKQYQVVLAAETEAYMQVGDMSAMNSKTNPDDVKRAIADASIVTTAIGPNILPYIAELIAESLLLRLEENKHPLNVIACENMVGASAFLREKIFAYIPEDKQKECAALFGFPNAAVDRIVPNEKRDNLLDVAVEPYFEWVVEEPGFKGEKPVIDGMTYVADLQPYIERKLFTVNTGHIVPAYMGYYIGHETIGEAMQDTKIEAMIQGVLDETGEALIRVHGFDREQHETYKQTIITRFKNPYVSDMVTRVGRNPIQKLGATERLIYPAKLYVDHVGDVPKHLPKLIAFALLYDPEADEQAVKLQQMIKEQGYKETLMDVTGLDLEDPLLTAVLDEVKHLTSANQ